MPKNRWIYIGILIVAAVALTLFAKFVLRNIDPLALYIAGGLGVVLIVIGLVTEAKTKTPTKPTTWENKTDV